MSWLQDEKWLDCVYLSWWKRSLAAVMWFPLARVQDVQACLQRFIFIDVIRLWLLFIISLLDARSIIQVSNWTAMINVTHLQVQRGCLRCLSVYLVKNYKYIHNLSFELLAMQIGDWFEIFCMRRIVGFKNRQDWYLRVIQTCDVMMDSIMNIN